MKKSTYLLALLVFCLSFKMWFFSPVHQVPWTSSPSNNTINRFADKIVDKGIDRAGRRDKTSKKTGGLIESQPVNQPVKKVKQMKKSIGITPEDREYFVSTVIDYLGDDEEFGVVIDPLTAQEAQDLYQKIENSLAALLRAHQKDLFSSAQERDKWILGQIENIRKQVLRDGKNYRGISSKTPKKKSD